MAHAGVRVEKSKLFDSEACVFKLSPAAGVKFHTFSENARRSDYHRQVVAFVIVTNLTCRAPRL